MTNKSPAAGLPAGQGGLSRGVELPSRPPRGLREQRDIRIGKRGRGRPFFVPALVAALALGACHGHPVARDLNRACESGDDLLRAQASADAAVLATLYLQRAGFEGRIPWVLVECP